MNVILLTGDLASYKTTLAKRLRDELNIPALIKDDLKETLFGAFEHVNETTHAQLSSVTFELMMALAPTYQSNAILLEGNFKPYEVSALNTAFSNALWFFVTAQEAVRYERYLAREPSRHQAHQRYGTLSKEAFKRANREALEHMHVIDTTTYDETMYKNLKNTIDAYLTEGNE